MSADGPKADHVAFGAAPGIAFGRGLRRLGQTFHAFPDFHDECA